jgi:hypothetical protein
MQLAQPVAAAPPWIERAMRITTALVVLAALAFAIAQVAVAATHEDRCRDLVRGDTPSDHISFEAEGCRTEARAPAGST